MLIKNVNDLVVYQLALELAKEIHQLIETIPYNWNVPEVDDIKRSSSSVVSNIAEGFGQRFHVKKFVYYLYISTGSSDESQSHLEKLMNKGYIPTNQAKSYIKRYKDLSIRIVNFMNYLRKRHGIKHII